MAPTIIPSMQGLRGMRLKDYLIMVLRWRWIVIVSFLSVVGSTVFYMTRVPDVYESYATLVIEEQNNLIAQAMNNSGRPLSFYEGILNSRTYLEMVLDSVGMGLINKSYPRMNRDDGLAYIKNSIALKTTSYASFLNFTARGATAELSYLVASLGTDIFRRRCLEVETEESRRGVLEIEKQLDIIRVKLERAEREYRSYLEQAGNILEGVTPELQNLQGAYATAKSQLGIKEADLMASKKQLELLEGRITPREESRSPEYLKLRSKLSELEKEKMRFENLGIRLSGVSAVEREIEEIEQQLLKYGKSTTPKTIEVQTIKEWQKLRESVLGAESELELFKRRLESYHRAIAEYKKGNPNILSQSLELLRLKRSKEIYENVYNILLQRSEEERLRSASSNIGIKIIDVARVPQSPIPKNQTSYYLLAILMGLGLGLGLAFLAEFNDTTIKSNDDVEKYLGLPVLGTIPHINHKAKDDITVKRTSNSKKSSRTTTNYPRNLMDFSTGDSIIAESYRSLRTNLSFASPDKPLQCVIITSAGPGEGKSLTTTNLAMAYAQMGKKTLLIDADLRRPVLHRLFNVSREPGLSELFMENPDYSKIIRQSVKPNLSFITAGIFTPNPAELIGSHKMVSLIDYFKQNFDMIFIDTPPIVAVTDATLMGAKTDGVLMVIKSHHADREIVSRAANILLNIKVKIIGTILNDIDLTHRYSSYGYYKYYYHYYKSKKD